MSNRKPEAPPVEPWKRYLLYELQQSRCAICSRFTYPEVDCSWAIRNGASEGPLTIQHIIPEAAFLDDGTPKSDLGFAIKGNRDDIENLALTCARHNGPTDHVLTTLLGQLSVSHSDEERMRASVWTNRRQDALAQTDDERLFYKYPALETELPLNASEDEIRHFLSRHENADQIRSSYRIHRGRFRQKFATGIKTGYLEMSTFGAQLEGLKNSIPLHSKIGNMLELEYRVRVKADPGLKPNAKPVCHTEREDVLLYQQMASCLASVFVLLCYAPTPTGQPSELFDQLAEVIRSAFAGVQVRLDVLETSGEADLDARLDELDAYVKDYVDNAWEVIAAFLGVTKNR